MEAGTLPEKMRKIRSEAEKNYPEHVLEVMDEATEKLKESKLTENAKKTGDTIPDFTLPNTHGDEIRSTTLLADGPLVINFYRGYW